MKQFMLFSWDHYYPGGGMKDFVMSFDTLDDAHNYIMNNNVSNDFCDIFDIQTDVMYQYMKNNDGIYERDNNIREFVTS